jgi:hypothetical protein
MTTRDLPLLAVCLFPLLCCRYCCSSNDHAKKLGAVLAIDELVLVKVRAGAVSSSSKSSSSSSSSGVYGKRACTASGATAAATAVTAAAAAAAAAAVFMA